MTVDEILILLFVLMLALVVGNRPNGGSDDYLDRSGEG